MGTKVKTAAVLAGLLLLLALEPGPRPGEFRAGVETLVLIGVSVVLSLLANYLLKPKEKSLTRDDKPTTVATRGAFLPYVVGRRRVGALFLWAGGRSTKKEDVGGGKGGGKSSKTTVYYEQAWHGLCLGPGTRLHRILQNGKAIFNGPIDPASFPSGTAFDLGKEGQFSIYWGEGGQPVNAFLGDSSRVGISSRWPFLMYIIWASKRLGTAAQWPLLDYEVETSTYSSRLVESKSYIQPTRTLSGVAQAITAVTNGGPRTAKFRIAGHQGVAFDAGSWLKLTGNAATNRDYKIYKSVQGSSGGSPITDVFLDDALSGANVAGNIQPYTLGEDDGYNHAHVLDQVLFEQWPHGIALDRTEWDEDALEQLGRECETENIRASVIAQDGEEAKSVVAAIAQDVGFMMGMDPTTGKVRPRTVRKPSGTLPNLTADILLPPPPERDAVHEDLPTDRSVYTFQDRALNFRDKTLAEDDDATASLLQRVKIRKVQLSTVVEFGSAAKVAERRAQEDMASIVAYKLNAARQARLMMPGQAFTAANIPGVLRCFGVTPDPETGRVVIDAMADYYGAEVSTFTPGDTPFGEPGFLDAAEDLAFGLLEVPAYLVGSKTQVAAVPRIRANSQVVQATVHASPDGTTYTQVATELDMQTGGTLATAINAADSWNQSQGPTINALGPDIAQVLDLSSDPTNWRIGRQLAMIDDELFFLKKVTALGGGQYRLDGLIRARYDTDRALHSIGANVFIFLNDGLTTWQDPLLYPGLLRYFKTQPQAGSSVLLADVTALQKTLRGKGVTPMNPLNLRVSSMVNAYVTGATVVLKWGYRSALSPKTGAGMQPAGGATGPSPVDGLFQVQITTTGDVVKREFTQAGTSYSYSAADRTTDGLEGSNFKVKIKNVSGGFSSSELSITVVNVP